MSKTARNTPVKGPVTAGKGAKRPAGEVARSMRLSTRTPDPRRRGGDRHVTRTREEAADLARIREQVGLDITAALDEARLKIDWKRRRAAEKSLLAWISTYGVGVFIDDVPDGHLPEVVAAVETALGTARPYQVLMPRKHGKTSYVAAAAAWLMVTGQCRFLCVIGANRDAACDILANIFLLTDSDRFAQDYPEICVPIARANGGRRAVTYRDRVCNFRKTSRMIRFPTVFIDGERAPASGVVCKAFGKNSAIRGQRDGTTRPDVVLLDDIQTKDSARNARRVKADYERITRDIANLSGRKKLKIMNAATVICPHDLAETLKADKAWKTTYFRAFISWPEDYVRHPNDGLWAEYFRIYESEDVREAGHHKESLAFYEAHRAEMDAGADVLTPSKFDPDQWEVSTVQAYMNKIHADGLPAFNAEFQMEPDVGDFALKIAPKDVLKKDGGFAEFSAPAGYLHIFAATDLNVSYALTTTVTAFKADGSGAVVLHERHQVQIGGKLNGRAYYRAVFAALSDYAARLADYGLPIVAWGIDAGGKPFDAATDFAKACAKVHGVRCVAMQGVPSHKLNLMPRNALQTAREECVLVGDAARMASTAKEPAGREWLRWNTDLYRENVQKALLSPLGSLGSLDLYHTAKRERDEFAVQVTNEKLLTKIENGVGRTEFKWESKDPHDYLDSTAACMALAAFFGVGTQRAGVRRRKGPRRQRITCL